MPDLIGLCLATFTLQIDLFFNPSFSKDVVTAPNSHFKTQVQEQLAKVIKSDDSIHGSAQHSLQRLSSSHHNILHQDDAEEWIRLTPAPQPRGLARRLEELVIWS